MKQRYMILDMDNCISNDEWRIQYIDWQLGGAGWFRRYHRYHSLSPWDEAANPYLWRWMPQALGAEILISTSRFVHYRAITEEWLRRAGVKHAAILMRNDNDFRPSEQVKKQHLEWLLSDLYGLPKGGVVKAFDDKPEIVDMYRKAGIDAERVFIHQRCAYTQQEAIEHGHRAADDRA